MLPSTTKDKRGSNWGQWLGGLAGIAVLALAFWALRRIAADTSWAQIMASVHGTPVLVLAMAVGFVASSYAVLVCYDWLATRHLGYRIKATTLALASFCSFTMSHTLGLTVLTGGTVRYRIYTRAGVKPLDVALIVLLCGITFWLGIIAVGGVGLLASPELARPFGHLARDFQRMSGVAVSPTLVEQWAGILLLVTTLAYLVFGMIRRTPIKFKGLKFTLPDWRETLAQIGVGALDLAFAAAALYVLLPATGRPPFADFMTIYAVAMVVGALSHAPGGLGVFEVVCVKLLHDIPKPEVLGALVLFRLLYTLIPFLIGLTLLTIAELRALNAARHAERLAASAP